MPKKIRLIKIPKVTVPYDLLFRRVNYKLAQVGTLKLCKARKLQAGELGDYYLIEKSRGVVAQRYVDPIELARDLGVLRSHEEVKL